MNAPFHPSEDDIAFGMPASGPLSLRAALERAIEGLIALLDVVDQAGFVEDLEETGDDEPTAGSNSVTDECEIEEDSEPSLAAPENHPGGFSISGAIADQSEWSGGIAGTTDAEEEANDEPSLGWTTTFNQTARQWQGGTSDGEQGDDNGIADDGGIRFDDEPSDHGIADSGGADEVNGELAVRDSFALDRARRGVLPLRRPKGFVAGGKLS